MVIMLTNFLIAVISKSFEDINSQKEKTYDKERLILILEAQQVKDRTRKDPFYPRIVISRLNLDMEQDDEEETDYSQLGYSAMQSLQLGWNKGMKKVESSNKDIQKLNSSMGNLPYDVKDIQTQMQKLFNVNDKMS